MIIREDAIYGRQSVDRKDSISIESQIEFCKYELRGGNFRKYTDKGYSGKNTDRPKFQEMMADIRRGLIKRVVVYKLDRISRSILDFATMMETFQEYNVEFVSSTEKFDTSTPMGRAMLNICIVFAQLERETIQKRVTDAYYSRCQHGFHMSGAAPYGFQLEPTTIEGIRTKMMKPDPETADIAKLMFEMYSQPGISFGDIARYFADEGILIYGKEMKRGFISQLLRNPIYAQADLDMYEFFKSQGTVVVNEATDFAGTNGCYLYQGRDVQERKNKHLKDQILVLAPSEGLVSSDTWLRCRKKLMANKTFQGGRKAKNTWLAGKVKCGRCGYSDTTEDTIIVVYANEEGEMLKFSYSHNPDNTTWFVGADSLTVQPITINGISGEAITSTEQGAATAIMWITTENTAFNISGFLSVEDLIAMAESVQIIKP